MSKPNKKKVVRNKNSRSNKQVMSKVMFDRQVMPLSLQGRLPYSESGVSINPGASGVISYHVYSLNGLFDPNITGTGHQPRGFDQYMALYDHYLVREGHYEIQIAPSDTDCIVGVCVTDSGSGESAIGDYIERADCKWQVLLASSTKPAVFKGKINIGKWLKRKFIDDDDVLQGSSSANPAEGVFLEVFGGSLDASTDSSALFIAPKFEYVVEFREPKQPTSS